MSFTTYQDAQGSTSEVAREWTPVQLQVNQLRWDQTVPGQVRVEGVVKVAAEVSGRIVEVLAEEGDEVESGELLARFETDVFEARLRQAQAQLDAARAREAAARTQLADARRMLDRRERVAENGWISPEALEQRRSDLAVRLEQVQITESEVELALARHDSSRIELERTEVHSPARGQITRRSVEVGETVNAVQSAPLLFEITRSDADISIYVEVSETLVGALEAGQGATVRAAALGAHSLNCTVTRVFRRPVNRSGFIRFGVMIACSVSHASLWSGMSVDVDLEIFGREEALLIPVSAFLFVPGSVTSRPVRHRPGWRGLWVRNVQGEFIERSVLTGFSDGQLTEVLDSNLELDDVVFEYMP